MSTGFAALGLSPALQRAVADRGYAEPTPIQAVALPLALQGRDLIASAHTGSGKTAAFGLALLQPLDTPKRPVWRKTLALVLVPTRELAAQVGETLRALCQHFASPIKVAVVFGGVSINPQMMALRGGAELVVATPGRLLDLVGKNALQLMYVDRLVLDEADRLLDEGFADELAQITALLPAQRQSLFFSATFPPAVQALAQALLRDPVRVEADKAPIAHAADADGDASTAAPQIQQRAIEVDAAQRTQLLRHLVEQGAWPRVLVFVATRYASEHVAEKLRRAGLAAAAFHGDLSQGARSQVLADLRSGALRVVLATDMAARGLHIAGLPVVVNYDLPRSAEDHTHRIGRTARAGASGLAVSFVSAATEAHFRLIEKRQGQRVPRELIAGFEPRDTAAPPSAPEGGVKGRRKSKKDKLREAAALEAARLKGA
ncbi:DNA/RNA helicase, superfamily II [Burkholderiales bacterium JOSHI_001]|nr:DNA/RNA helicase, superfamily II [Burkholderiales bacterium JOSHI_001]